MKENQLSHKDLVKLGRYELSKGHSLNDIEADFLEKGVDRKDAMKALEEIDYYNQKNKIKAKEEEAAKKFEEKKAVSKGKETAKKESSFWIYILVFLALAGLALYYYFYNKNF